MQECDKDYNKVNTKCRPEQRPQGETYKNLGGVEEGFPRGGVT